MDLLSIAIFLNEAAFSKLAFKTTDIYLTNHRNGEVFKIFEMTNVKFSSVKIFAEFEKT